MKKRLLATLLAICLLVGMLPLAASAAETETISPATLHDTRTTGSIPDGQLCTGYTVNTAEDSTNNATVITVGGTDLRYHQNGGNPENMGYWAGVAIKPTDAATVKKMKYGISFTKSTADSSFDS